MAAVWLAFTVVSAWRGNHGQPWVYWAFMIETPPAAFFSMGSLLAWRGGRLMQRLGWGLIGCIGFIELLHTIRELADLWQASR